MAEPKPRKPRQTALALKVDDGPRLRECALQGQVIAVLSGMGYTCLEVGASRRKVRCPECEKMIYPEGFVGNTPGCADVLVSRRGWPAPIWVALELKIRARTKAQSTKVRIHQKMLADAGQNVIVTSIAQAIDALAAAEAALGADNPRLSRFWENNPRHRFE